MGVTDDRLVRYGCIKPEVRLQRVIATILLEIALC